jgi:arsenate reductase
VILLENMTKRLKVLFLCTENSSRSQIAEAITNHLPDARWEAFSAGTHPGDEVNPLAIRALEEIGIHHQGWPKAADEYRQTPFDLVVTVCDDAAEECPVWLGVGRRRHLGFPDPAKATGTEAERLDAFRRVRDDMLVKVPALLAGE